MCHSDDDIPVTVMQPHEEHSKMLLTEVTVLMIQALSVQDVMDT